MIILSGCGYLGVCDDSYRPGIEIIFKNVDGEYIASDVTAVVFEDNYQDTLIESSFNEMGQVVSLSGAYERPGRYSLIVVSPLYETYTDTDIVIRNGECHVKVVELEVTLAYK